MLQLEAGFEKDAARYDKLLEAGGCFQEDPHAGQISSFAVWTHEDPGEEACRRLFRQRRDKAREYQSRVRSMMLEKDYNRFSQALSELYAVAQSLHLRLKAQGCEGPEVTPASQGGAAARKPLGPFHAFEPEKMLSSV